MTYLTRPELAKRLGISAYIIKQLMNEGLPYLRFSRKTIRFSLESVEAWLLKRQTRHETKRRSRAARA